MNKSENNLQSLLCMACLCVERSLKELKNDKLKQYYLHTLNEIPLCDKPLMTPVICWECEALLKKALSFREQVKDSYRILQTYAHENLYECLLRDVSRTPRLKVHINDPVVISPDADKENIFKEEVKIEENDEAKKLTLDDCPKLNTIEQDLSEQPQSSSKAKKQKRKVEEQNLPKCLLRKVSRPPRLKGRVNNPEPKSSNAIKDLVVKEEVKVDVKDESQNNTVEDCSRLKVMKQDVYKQTLPLPKINNDKSNNEESHTPVLKIEFNPLKDCENVLKLNEDKAVMPVDIKFESGCSGHSNPESEDCRNNIVDDICTSPISIGFESGLEEEVNEIKAIKKRRLVKLKNAKKIVTRRKIKQPDKKPQNRKILTLELTYDEMLAEREKESKRDTYVKAQYKCETCLIGFHYNKSYKAHLVAKHSPNIGDYSCPICKTVISSVESFTAHYKRHMKRYECTICQKRTIDVKAMQQHYYSTHEVSLKEYKCNMCGHTSNSIDTHRYHKDTHKARVQCDECDKTFSHRSGLMNHRLAVHELQNEFPCTVCAKVFRWKTSLKRHLEKHDNKSKTTAVDGAYCTECDIGFSSVCSLQRHLRNSLKHVTQDQLKFVCDHCKRRFADKTKLRDHIEEKHLNRTYQCHICQKTSKNRVGLEQHVRNVHKGRPNNKMCHYCGKGFPTKVQLESHIRTHKGERPFIWEYCPTTFSQQSNIYKHHRQDRQNTLPSKKAENFSPKIVSSDVPSNKEVADEPPPPPPMPFRNGDHKIEVPKSEEINFSNINLKKTVSVTRTPTPDYNKKTNSVVEMKVKINGHDNAEVESLESYKLKNPSSVQPKPPPNYFIKAPNGTATMKKNVRPVSVTIGEYVNNVGNRKEPSKLEFLNDDKTDGRRLTDDEPISSRLQSELALTLSRSNLRKKTEALDNALYKTSDIRSMNINAALYSNENFFARYGNNLLPLPPSITIPKVSKIKH